MITPKTIYLESDEEITSVIDKIRKTEFADIVLVIPKGATITQSIVNLKLIKKKAESLNKNISIVTGDKVARTLAEKVGIATGATVGALGAEVFEPAVAMGSVNDPLQETNEVILDKEAIPIESADLVITEGEDTEAEAEEKEELLENIKENGKKTKNDNLMPGFPWKKILLFGGIPLIALLVVAYIYLPQAKANIFVNAEKTPVTLDISGQKGVKLDLEKSVIPTQVIEVTKESSKKSPATGKKDVGTKATGVITIANTTASDSLPVQTFSPSSNTALIYTATQAIVIKANKVENINVTASGIGENFNGFSGSVFFAVKAPSISGTCNSGMAGGTTKQVTIVTQGDFDSTKEALIKTATEEATTDFNAKAKDLKLIESTKKTETISVTSSPDVGAEGESFTVIVKISVRALAISNNDLSALIKYEVKRQLGGTKEIIDDGSGVVNLAVDAANLDEGTLSGTITTTAFVAPKLDKEKIQINLEGLNNSQAKSYLLDLDGVGTVELEYFPSFIKSFPRLKNHIYVNVKVSDSSKE